MAEFVINAEPRKVLGKKVKRLRAEGLVPATIYGPKTNAISVQIPYRPLEISLRNAGGTNLIELKVNGESHTVVARDVQRDVLKGNILHVDFFAVTADTRIRADIPIHLIGESPIVATRQGILLTGTNSVTLEMQAGKLLNRIEVDLSELTEIGDSMVISDLELDPSITVINDPNEMLARVVQPSAARAELLEELEEGDLDEEEEISAAGDVEVISRGKEEEDEEDL